MTPRKPRQRQRDSHSQPTPLSQVQASDYESDIQYTPTPTTRTNTELNLSVLRRYNPSIHSILSIAASAVVYVFSPSTSTWDKSGVEGPLFVCELEPSPVTGIRGFCLVVMNKRALENVILNLGIAEEVEMTGEYVIIRTKEGGGDEDMVYGFYMHADKHDTREVNGTLVKECWQRARSNDVAVGIGETEDYGGGSEKENVGPNAAPALGRRISLNTLFGQ